MLNRLFKSQPVKKGSFKEQQQRYERVRTAYKEREDSVKKFLLEQGINSFRNDVFLRIFKKEKRLEVWAKNKDSLRYIHLKSYFICSSSGGPGPKRYAGDGQVPEGFYYINSFNPFSSFYLSLKVSYPNQSDRILGNRNNPGGDIFIHGYCVTIGCIPIDDCIKELYILAVEAKSAGQDKIPVHIFPSELDDSGFKELEAENESSFSAFWKNLKEGYDYFEKNRFLPVVSVAADGKYLFR
jgi:murein L,D-transpeptidase YafK